MPNPSPADLHFNVPLTNVSIAYLQNASTYIADKVFPKVPVNKQSDAYYVYPKADWRRTRAAKRAPGTQSVGDGWRHTSDSYFAHVYAIHKDIDDQTRANADSVFNLERDSTEFITNQLLLKRDVDWNAAYFKAGVWGTDKDGDSDFTKWSEPGSDPISDFAGWRIDFIKATGFAPNICVMGAHVLASLQQHPDIIDRIKYTQRGVVTEDLLASLFKIPELYTSYATMGSGPEINDAADQEAATTYDFLSESDSLLLAYAPKSPSTMTPSAGYTFTWRGYLGGNSQGIRIKRFRMEEIASDRIEAEMTYDMKVVCPDMGMFIKDAVVAS